MSVKDGLEVFFVMYATMGELTYPADLKSAAVRIASLNLARGTHLILISFLGGNVKDCLNPDIFHHFFW